MTDDLAVGFALVNAGLVLCGLWCYAARVRPGHSSGPVFAWLWTVLEFGNGIGHIALALSQGQVLPRRGNGSCAARDVNVSGRHTLGSALVMASSRCSVEDVQGGSRE